MSGNNLNQEELSKALKDVRKSYRLLYEYQRRVMDLTRYIGNSYGYHDSPKGFHWFSYHPPKWNKPVDLINHWAWDWLGMYLFEFYFGEKEVETETVKFSVVLQSDTGYFDALGNSQTTSKTDINKFENSESATTRLIFRTSTKGWDELWDNNKDSVLSKDRWEKKDENCNQLAIAYNLEGFINQKATDEKIKDFAEECRAMGIPIKEEEK